MSVLKEKQCYGLSSRKLCRGNISVFHVKLTDSAARAIGTFQNDKGRFSHPTICFNENQGRITVPCSENRGEVRTFTFSLTNVASDNPHGSFDCVQQLSTGAGQDLSCVGVIQTKMTVNATDDSYHKAFKSIAQAEEETRSRGAIVIKHRGRSQGMKNRKYSHIAGVSNKKSLTVVEQRPLRERLIHLLALRPYRRPELILRLQRDGLTAGDKNIVDTLLLEVGQLNSRDSTYVLKDCLYKDLQRDWPGYTTGDQQLLKRILVRRLFQPQQNLLSVPEAQVSPLRDTPNSSPAHPQKHFHTEEYTDPLASKRPRISHFSSKTASKKSRSKASEQQEAPRDVAEATEDNSCRNSLDPRKLFDSLSVVCKQETEVAKRLEPAPFAVEDAKAPAALHHPDSDHPPSPLNVPQLDKHSRKRRKSKHKHRDQVRAEGLENYFLLALSVCIFSPSLSEPSGMLYDSKVLQSASDTADYLLKYTAICTQDQRLSYKQDFNMEYSEYRDLHARIDSVTQQFMELDAQLKQLESGSRKYKTIHNRILQEYQKIKKSNPNYNQDKMRCEYLHNKLSHIKKLISNYDQQQLSVDCDCHN
uniref:RNA polymerase II elongation factor ELL-like n=1 Tax=Myripristis murdjan TaxID=586833 RepID=A0A668AWB2_9TELE